jgi:hypothetical protein
MAPDVSRRPGCDPNPVGVGLLVGRVALGQFFLPYFGFTLSLTIIPPMPHDRLHIRAA